MADPLDDDYFLDRYPVTPDELRVLLSLEQEYSKNGSCSFPNTSDDDDLLAILFSTAYANVFCVNDTPRDRFLEAAVSLLGRRGDRFLWDALFEYAMMQTREVNDEEEEDLADSTVLLGLVFSLATRALQKDETVVPDGFCQCLSQAKISRAEWIKWAMRLPGNSLHRALSTVFSSAIFGPDWPNTTTVFSVPTFFATHEAIALAGMGLNHGAWRKLYNSDENGLSFHTFREALLGYFGTTIILIRTTDKDCLGYYTQVPWKTSPKWFTGEGTSFLFRLSPSWNVYPVADENVMKGLSTTKIRYHQYLNLPPVQQTKQNSLRGLAIGGVAADAPRLLINEKLEQCQASFNDLSFVQGPLLSDPDNYFFDVDLLEVWTVESSEDDLRNGVETGKLQAAVREGVRQRLAHVDRKEFLQDFTSGAVMTTLFDHRQQARGRADFVASEDESKGYFVESKPPSPRISGRKVRSGSVNELDWE